MPQLLAQVLPADSTSIQEASSVVEGMTKPILSPKSFNLMTSLESWGEALLNFGIRVVLSVILFMLGSWLIGKLRRLIISIMIRRQWEGVAISLINSIIVALLYMGLGIGIAATMGVQSVSFAAVLASLGLAIGMALSGQLQNLAGGVIIVVTKPFAIGNYIEAQNVEGVVRSVTLFHTVITTAENKIIYIPNGSLSNNVIINYNSAKTRRVEWLIGVDYEADMDTALALLGELLSTDERILKDPAHFVGIKALSTSSVDLVARAWVKTEDYWDVFFDLNKTIFEEFNKRGIAFPYPQLTISHRNTNQEPTE